MIAKFILHFHQGKSESPNLHLNILNDIAIGEVLLLLRALPSETQSTAISIAGDLLITHAIVEEEFEEEIPEVAEKPKNSSLPVLRLQKEDVAGEISFWSTAVFCYILGANPPSKVISGFVKRVWPSNGVDKVSFLPNGIFLVRFKTKQQQQAVLSNDHLIFDNKPVIITEWKPESKLLKHEVKKIPLWMKLYGLDIKFWGTGCLKKICGQVGQFIKCDEATAHRDFMGYARIMVEVEIGQQFLSEIRFIDETGKPQEVRVVYDWLPTNCTVCKGVGHTADVCRKGGTASPKKVWRPKAPAVSKTNQSKPVQPQKVV
ncbi:uncharacterized protein LOC141639797 [Silene latifolia]|uniref:uncharacterized protein LOC141639797 n=1 Tax=Silene latifolia TaxID=37657 RepID=UPI003D77E3E4